MSENLKLPGRKSARYYVSMGSYDLESENNIKTLKKTIEAGLKTNGYQKRAYDQWATAYFKGSPDNTKFREEPVILHDCSWTNIQEQNKIIRTGLRIVINKNNSTNFEEASLLIELALLGIGDFEPDPENEGPANGISYTFSAPTTKEEYTSELEEILTKTTADLKNWPN